MRPQGRSEPAPQPSSAVACTDGLESGRLQRARGLPAAPGPKPERQRHVAGDARRMRLGARQVMRTNAGHRRPGAVAQSVGLRRPPESRPRGPAAQHARYRCNLQRPAATRRRTRRRRAPARPSRRHEHGRRSAGGQRLHPSTGRHRAEALRSPECVLPGRGRAAGNRLRLPRHRVPACLCGRKRARAQGRYEAMDHASG